MFLLSSQSLQAFIPSTDGGSTHSRAPKEALARPTDRATEFTVRATRLMLPPFPPNYLATLLRRCSKGKTAEPNEKRGPLTDDKIPEGDEPMTDGCHLKYAKKYMAAENSTQIHIYQQSKIETEPIQLDFLIA